MSRPRGMPLSDRHLIADLERRVRALEARVATIDRKPVGRRSIMCWVCGGLGWHYSSDMGVRYECSHCEGKGRLP